MKKSILIMFVLASFFYCNLSATEGKLLKSVLYFNENGQKDFIVEYQYNNNDRIVKESMFKLENGERKLIDRFTYDYDKNICKGYNRTEHYDKGSYHFELENGNIVSSITVNNNSEKTYSTFKFLEDKKRLSAESITIKHPSADTVICWRVQYEYDNKKQVISRKLFNLKEDVNNYASAEFYTYNSKGQLSIYVEDLEFKKYIYFYEYNLDNRLISMIQKSQKAEKSDTVLNYKYEYVYDKYGNKKEIKHFFVENKKFIHNSTIEKTFDEHGNLLLELQKKMGTSGTGIVRKKEYEFNSENLETKFIDYQGNFNNKWNIRNEKFSTYNDNNQLVEILEKYWGNDTLGLVCKLVHQYTPDNLLEHSDYYTQLGDEWVYLSENIDFPVILSKASGLDTNIRFEPISWRSTDEDTLFFHRLKNYYQIELTWQNPSSVNSSTMKQIAVSNYPNPASQNTTIEYFVDTPAFAELTLFDANGMKLFRRNLGFKTPGNNEENIDVSNLKNGTYFYMLKIGEKVIRRKMIVSK